MRLLSPLPASPRRLCVVALSVAAGALTSRPTPVDAGLDNLDATILTDLLESYSTYEDESSRASCTASTSADKTTFAFTYPGDGTESEWHPAFQQYEQSLFRAEMSHTDDGDSSWTMRFGTGGNLYSLYFPDRHGETIPPQNHDPATDPTLQAGPWIDEVNQMVAVNGNLNQASSFKGLGQYCENGGAGLTNGQDTDKCSPNFAHQAGAYQVDSPYTDAQPFFSPALASHCSGNSCLFASWGTQAHLTTPFTNPILYIDRYTNCDDGIILHTMMIHNFADPNDSIFTDVGHTYFNVPWSSIRTSNLPHALEPDPTTGDLSYMDPNDVSWMYLCQWGVTNPNGEPDHDGPSPPSTGYEWNGQRADLDMTPGYTTFAGMELLVNNTNFEVPIPCKNDAISCQTDPLTCMVDSCTDTQVAQGYTRMQLKVRPNSSPKCRQHGSGANGVLNDNLVKMQCKFKDSHTFGRKTGQFSGLLQAKNVVGNACSPWSSLAFYNTRTGEYLLVAFIYHWSWNYNDPWVRFVPYYLGDNAVQAINDIDNMFDNRGHNDALLIDVRLTSNVDEAYVPANYNAGDANAFTFVYGQGADYAAVGGGGVPGSARRRMGSTKFGKHRRDYTVFTVNWRATTLGAGETYVNRAFYFASDLSQVKALGDELRDKVYVDKVALEDWTQRDVDIYKSTDGNHLDVATASAAGGTGTSCGNGVLACQGKSAPTAGHVAFFRVLCGSRERFGPDPYVFAVGAGGTTFQFPGHGTHDDPVRSYACDGEAATTRPSWKLLGFFPASCESALTGVAYDGTTFACATQGPGPVTRWDITFMNMTADFVAQSGGDVVAVYEVSKDRAHNVSIYASRCDAAEGAKEDVTPGVVTENATLSGKNLTHDVLTLAYDFDKALVGSSNVWNATSGRIEFCQRLRLVLGDMVIAEDVREFGVNLTLDGNFNLTNDLGPQTVEAADESASLDGVLNAFKCDGASFNDDTSALLPNDYLYVCIESIQNGVEIDSLESMTIAQAGIAMFEAIGDGAARYPSLTSWTYDGDTKVWVSTRFPLNAFDFEAPGASISVSGNVALKLADGSGRYLQGVFGVGVPDDSARESEFELEVKLTNAGVEDDAYVMSPAGALSGIALPALAAFFIAVHSFW